MMPHPDLGLPQRLVRLSHDRLPPYVPGDCRKKGTVLFQVYQGMLRLVSSARKSPLPMVW